MAVRFLHLGNCFSSQGLTSGAEQFGWEMEFSVKLQNNHYDSFSYGSEFYDLYAKFSRFATPYVMTDLIFM